jgi:hypothetical protein
VVHDLGELSRDLLSSASIVALIVLVTFLS